MMYSGDEDFGDDVTSGIFPDDAYEGELEQADFEHEMEDAEDGLDDGYHDDSVKCCPDCERPNQFGELCHSCAGERGEQAYS